MNINEQVDAHKCPQVIADADHMLEVDFYASLDVAMEVKLWV